LATRSEDPAVRCLRWTDGIGRTRVGRALAALTHVFEERESLNPGPRLLWALLGLEALYCDGKEGLKAQLIRKAQLLLGPFSSHKKSMSKLYDYRSRFVHGGLDLPISYRYRADDEDAGKFLEEAEDAAAFATVTLLASVQELVRRNWQTLDFDFVMLEPGEA
jgi:hypothetical protein